jgi:NitT/TauT family transport system substrate-binding protein
MTAVIGCRTQRPAASNGLTPVRLQLDWYPQPEHGGFFAAQLLGYYKAEGLEFGLEYELQRVPAVSLPV